MTNEEVTIVLAEDDNGHAQLIKRALKRCGLVNKVIHVRNGKEALDCIRSEGAYAYQEVSRSLILLLDIHMPHMGGIETLRQLRADERTKHIPVVMLTTTDDPREIELCYQLGCSTYMTKPIEYDHFSEAIKRLGLFLQIVKVPFADNVSNKNILK